ncbi:DUF1684 domain-containing protein [Clavibacter michiganensis subsp. phaseoli]|uniref:DUF1684 domain-containing protein n=1 Tax=Clavibacter phaseoli TaxID=1734031 RepID=A0A8I0SH53_9MICO|nr:DUF1684 domain-containing protein [Clavibacter phaseoli]MBF4629714.1 DUF1684 domain-containing protein [Clavibacter phaseoli]
MTDPAAPAAPAPTDPAEVLAVYRSRREQMVVLPQGNLALVNTQWISADAAPQPVYGIPGTWSPLEPGASGLRVQATAADGLRVDGILVDGEAIVRGRDDPQPSSVVASDTVSAFVIASEEGAYALRVWDARSDAIRDFGGIDAFPYSEEWVVKADFTPIEGGRAMGFEHLKDDGATKDKIVPGEITFTKDGVDYSLAAFREGRALLLVFSDATSGESTYGVGRFLMVAPSPDGTITLDFNRAYLPPCAFSYNFNCPMPPKQNRFAVPIEAGEKNVLAKDGGLLH